MPKSILSCKYSNKDQNRFKVIIPALIRDIVEDQDLPVRGGRLNALSPTKLQMELDTMLDTPLGVKIDPLGLRLHIPHGEQAGDDPFLIVDLPEKKVNGETEVKFPDQEVDIMDEAQLTAWFNDFFDAETTELRVVVPEMTAHLGALKYTVKLDKTIKVPGLNYLDGFSSIDQEIMIPPEDNGDNIKGHLNIPNSGTIKLGLANPSFFMMAGDIKLGLVTLPDLELKPGNNTVFYHGKLYLDALIPNLPEILASQGTALTDGYLAVNCTGNSTYTDDGEQVKYLEGVLNTKKIPLRIPITQLMGSLLGGLLDGSGGGLGNSTGGGSLLDRLGDVVGNRTLFDGMLDRFENPT